MTKAQYNLMTETNNATKTKAQYNPMTETNNATKTKAQHDQMTETTKKCVYIYIQANVRNSKTNQEKRTNTYLDH